MPAVCAPPGLDARRPMAAIPAQPRPFALLAYDRRCAGSQAWRSRLHLQHDRAPPQRRPRAMSIINATAPRESAGETRAFPACLRDVCPASLPRVGPHPACDCCRLRPCASHGRLSLRRPPPPPRSRCHAAIPRESAAAATVSIAASAIVSITVESSRHGLRPLCASTWRSWCPSRSASFEPCPPRHLSGTEWRRHCTVYRVRAPAGGGPLCGPLPPGPLLQ